MITLAAVMLARNALISEPCAAALACNAVMFVVAVPRLASTVAMAALAAVTLARNPVMDVNDVDTFVDN